MARCSRMVYFLERLISVLEMPGPQQTERGELPITPTLAGWAKDAGSKARFTPSRGSSLRSGLTRSGSPADAKSELDISSRSSDEVIGTGKPLCMVTIPE